MASNVNNQVGDVSLKMGVDASSVAAEAKAAAEIANSAAEAELTKQVNQRDAALRRRQQQISAAWAAEREQFREHLNRMAADESSFASGSFGSGGTAKATSTLTERMKEARNSFTGLFQEFQKFAGITAIVTAVAASFYKLGTTISEFVFGPLQSASDKAQEFRNALDDRPRERLAALTKEMERLNAMADGSTTGLIKMAAEFKGGTGFNEYYKQIEASIKSTREAADKQLDTAIGLADAKAEYEAQIEANRYIERQNARKDDAAKYNAEVEKSIQDEETARQKSIQDFSDDMKKLGDEMTKQARRAQEAWVESLRAIREESNRAFNTDQAASMVQLAGNLRTTATIAGANMNRIIVGGED
jgi:hypothetical protein